MGKPFSSELKLIPSTIACSQDINPELLKRFINNRLNTPFLVVGSGGSFSVAQIIAMVINSMGGFAQAVTPFELMEFSKTLVKTSVLFFSASGSNPDILSAYTFCKRMEAKDTFIFCLSSNSKLAQTAREGYSDEGIFECDLPSGKDGFLAVNSTIFAIAILRRMTSCFSPFSSLPLLPGEIDDCIKSNAIIALGGRWTIPAVTDFESKCTEAGLINVLPADLRNFAHGRHHWLAKHPNTAVICFVSRNELALAQKTISILPRQIKKCIIVTDSSGLEATNEMLLSVFQVVQKLGELKQIDPGKPGVPRFGSQIYRLNYRLSVEAEKTGLLEKQTIMRMTKRKQIVMPFRDQAEIKRAAENYLKKLQSSVFKGIILDYDNTIISDNSTDNQVYLDCIAYINQFLGYEIGICFATGRGKSIRDHLQKVINPDFFDKVLISYYNGVFVLPLSADLPPVTDSITAALTTARNYIVSRIPESEGIETIRNECLTYEGNSIFLDSIYKTIASAILRGELSDVKVSKSDHSIDVVPKHVSKKNAIKFMNHNYGNEILCIGDSGDEFGNDYDLLDSEYSLSVDQVSSSLDSCWNIASLGLRGPSATREYLSKLSILKKGLRFSKNYLQIT